MADLRQIAAEIEIRGKSEGVEEIAAGLRQVTEAGQPAARVIERTEQVTNSAERSFQKLEGRFDKVVDLERKREKALSELNRAQASGVVTGERYEDLQRKINAQYSTQINRARGAERAQDSLNREMAEAPRQLNLMSGAATAARGALVGLVAGISFGAITSGAKEAVAALDEIAKKARSLGGIEEAGFLQSSRFALGQLGFEQAQADKLLSDFQRRLGQFQLGTGELGTILQRTEGGAQFGAELRAAKGLEEQFDVALRKLGEVEDASKRAALAGALFGEEAAKNIGALAEAGVEGFQSLRQEAEKAGLIIPDEVLERAEVMNDRLSEAQQIIGVQMKVAFAEIAPLIIGITEATADFIRRTSAGLRELRLETANPEKVDSTSELEAIREKTERDLARAEEQARRYQEGAERQKAALENIGLGFLQDNSFQPFSEDVERLRDRLDDVNARLFQMGAQSITSTDQLAEALGAPVAAAAELSDALAKAVAERDKLAARLEAAQGGDAALKAFDVSAGVNEKIAASGLVGVEADALRGVLEESAKLKAETAEIEKNYKGSASAAADLAKATAQTRNIAAEIADLEKLVAVAPQGRAAIEAEQRRLSIMRQLDREEEQARRAKQAFNREEREALEFRRQQLQAELALRRELAAIETSVLDLQEELAIAGLPEREYEAAHERLLIEREIRDLKEQAAAAGVAFDESAARAALMQEAALRKANADTRELARTTDKIADDFIDRLAAGDPTAFRNLGRQIFGELKRAALDPLEDALSNLLRGVFSGVFAGGNPAGAIFTPGIAASPAAAFGGAAANGAFANSGYIAPQQPFGGIAAGGLFSAAALIPLLSLGATAATGSLAPLAFGALGSVGGAALVSQLGKLGVFGSSFGAGDKYVANQLLKAGSLGNVAGGIIGSVGSSLLFGNSTGVQVGSTIGGVAGNLIPVPILGPLVGSLLGGFIGSLFGGKPSNKVGQVYFDPATGVIGGEASKDRSEESLRNLDAAKSIAAGISDAVTAIVGATGGRIADKASTAFWDNLVNVAVGSVRGVEIGYQGVAGEQAEARQFENSEAGAQAAAEYGIRLALKALDTPFEALDRFIAKNVDTAPIEQFANDIETLANFFKAIDELSDKAKTAVEGYVNAAIAAGRDVSKTAEQAQKLAAIFEATRAPVDIFAQRTRDLKEAIEPLIADMKSLGQSTADLEAIQREALDQIGKDRNDLSRQLYLGVENPLLAQAEAFIKEASLARAGAEEAKAGGAPVDLALLFEAERAQALAPFNLAARVGSVADPAAQTLRATAEAQLKEIEALQALIAAGFATSSDLFRLQTAQAGERANVLRSLPEADQLRLAGSDEFQAFTDISGRIGILLTSILTEFERFEDGLDDFRQNLQNRIESGKRLVADYDTALFSFAGRGTPGTHLKDLRQQFDDAVTRALSGDEASRSSLVDLGTRLREKTLEVNASSIAAQQDLKRVEAGITQVRDVVAGEVSDAEKELALLEESVEIQREMRDLLARETFDPAEFARLAEGLPGSDPLRALALELAGLKQDEAGIKERAAALIANTPPDEVYERLALLDPAHDAVGAINQSISGLTAQINAMASAIGAAVAAAVAGIDLPAPVVVPDPRPLLVDLQAALRAEGIETRLRLLGFEQSVKAGFDAVVAALRGANDNDGGLGPGDHEWSTKTLLLRIMDNTAKTHEVGRDILGKLDQVRAIIAGDYAPKSASAPYAQDAGVYAPPPRPANDAPVPFAPSVGEAPPIPQPLAAPAAAGALDDDILEELTMQTRHILSILEVLTEGRDNDVKHTDKLSSQLGTIINNQVKKAI
ncbi:MAG: hypothetical protein AB7P23_01825 [Amphiplicatus sp.]